MHITAYGTKLCLQLKYPSALNSLEQITTCARGQKIALFLDYDGTLSPIVDNPDHAYMPSAVNWFPTEIITRLIQ